MEKLPEELTKNGFQYRLIKRDENKAMYEHYEGHKVGGYEVFKIRHQKEKEIKFGDKMVFYKAKELYPVNEDFGKTAWYYTKKEPAEECYASL